MMKYEPYFRRTEFRSPAKHFWFKGINRGVVYPLIPKNGCSSFKNFLSSRFHWRYFVRIAVDKILQQGSAKRLVWPYWEVCVSAKVIEQNDFIFVYRDPADRLVSAFKNKFIDNRGSRKILSSFQNAMRISPEDACFNDFVEYTAHPFASIDAHVWPQKAQLLPVSYLTIKLGDLMKEMSKIVGSAQAEHFFKKRLNQSEQAPKPMDANAADLPVHTLRRARSQGLGVTGAQLLTSDNLSRIRGVYWQDYEMLERFLHETTHGSV